MKDLNESRLIIDDIDKKMKELFIKRMETVKDIALYKKQNGLAIFDEKRESAMFERLGSDLDEDLKNYYLDFLKNVVRISKEYQKELLKINEI